MRRDDPFDDFFEELERMMNDVMGGGSLGMDDAARATGDVHVDVQETDDALHVIADVPGVDKEAIDLRCDGTVLTIDASSDRRDYHQLVDLPARVDEHSADASYNNGILEVVFEREEDARDISLS
jgi:HSP20 family protein